MGQHFTSNMEPLLLLLKLGNFNNHRPEDWGSIGAAYDYRKFVSLYLSTDQVYDMTYKIRKLEIRPESWEKIRWLDCEIKSGEFYYKILQTFS